MDSANQICTSNVSCITESLRLSSNLIFALFSLSFYMAVLLPKARDAGQYECQISTEPKVSARVHLHVVGESGEQQQESISHEST